MSCLNGNCIRRASPRSGHAKQPLTHYDNGSCVHESDAATRPRR
ncbi:hypothetical protein RMSM_07435 [Rhodopirellula maiorica SM1]|uniref:Uncharacterized protein n=1 Tax=Rhodopirellula maiorica SM1 TaxID=1265738 RepID=M5RNQ2_9BACT|nr:hypothetical protein RMSM_07435 [Rhodopirellula maiorica SM1]